MLNCYHINITGRHTYNYIIRSATHEPSITSKHSKTIFQTQSYRLSPHSRNSTPTDPQYFDHRRKRKSDTDPAVNGISRYGTQPDDPLFNIRFSRFVHIHKFYDEHDLIRNIYKRVYNAKQG